MARSPKIDVQRSLLALALALAFLTLIPAGLSFVAVPRALSTNVEPAPAGHGHSVHYKNAATPAWIAEMLERNQASRAADDYTPRSVSISI
jgi:hypothetical protein